jgi:hypothetical protein
MLGEIRAGLRLRSGKRRLRAAFIGIFGGVWLAVEPAGLFFPDEFQWGWAGYLGLAGCSALAAVYVSKPPTEISRSLPPTNVSVAVRVGDVLAQNGNVVVGAADTFDTQPENDVISLASVQGQLLARSFGGDRAILDQLIGASIGPGQIDGSKTFGKRSRYPIGTVAVVRQGQTRYFLAAFTRMSVSLPAHVESSAEDLLVALARTWQQINAAGNGEPVHTPIIGSNLARLGLSKTLIIQLIVLSFIAATRKGSGPSALTIWIREEDRTAIDLAEVDEWLRGLCAV